MGRSRLPQSLSTLLGLIITDLSFQTEEPTVIPLSYVRLTMKDVSPNNLCKPYFETITEF